MSSPTIALVDPLETGHHSSIFRTTQASLLRRGCRVLAFYPRPDQPSAWTAGDVPEHVKSFDAFQLVAGPRLPANYSRFGRLVRDALIVLRWFRLSRALQAAERQMGASIDLVFLNYADFYVPLSFRFGNGLIRRFFKYPFSGVYYQPADYSKPKKKLRRLPLHLDACTSIGLLNESAAPAMAARNITFVSPG